MKRRDFFKLVPLTGFAAVFGIKLKDDPDGAVKKWTQNKREMPPAPISGQIINLNIKGQSFPIKTDEGIFKVSSSNSHPK